MNKPNSTTPTQESMSAPLADTGCTSDPVQVARRAVLRRGAKLVYVVPAVLAAMRAVPASANSVSGGLIGVLERNIDEVPAALLALVAEIHREFVAA